VASFWQSSLQKPALSFVLSRIAIVLPFCIVLQLRYLSLLPCSLLAFSCEVCQKCAFLVHVNVRSLQKNLEPLTLLLSELNYPSHFIAITETKINKDTGLNSAPNIPGYSFAHSDTQYAAGGVAIYTKDTILYVVRHDISEILTEAESLWLEDILNGKKTAISVIYRHPAPQYDSFTKELENILHNLNDKKVTYYICGDFNINLLQHESSQQVKNYTNLMLAYNCTQLITRPTRITDHSATLLDHVYTSNSKMPVQPGIILSDLSDHLPAFLMIRSSCLKHKHLSITLGHNYKSLDRITFLQEVKDALDMLPVYNGNPCQVVDNIQSIFNDTM